MDTAPAIAERLPDTNFEREQADRVEHLSVHFEEPIEVAAAVQAPRDYAADFVEAPQVEVIREPQTAEPVASLFAETSEAEQRDLDVPAFMRRHRF